MVRKSSTAEQKDQAKVKAVAKAVSNNRKEEKEAARIIHDALPEIRRLLSIE